MSRKQKPKPPAIAIVSVETLASEDRMDAAYHIALAQTGDRKAAKIAAPFRGIVPTKI